MTLEELKEIVNKKFDLDISKKTSKRHVVYAKKVFCKLAYELGYGYGIMAETINLSAHATAMHHVKTFSAVYKYHKINYNQIVLEYGLKIDPIEIKETTNKSDLLIFKEIYNKLLTFNKEQLTDFNNTRLEPYIKMMSNER